ncbi:hypothetical protein Ahy_A09g043459 [Arachis hypogaea]|uniref:Uncharacterized protein n=1 Tax=Arachis hypogaea TaxID=3818 RepID=A0A445BIB5_ARAHY|nr:hypothetical protein Ahy_A09g043459 [Arachis hypogaea]
MEPDDDDLDPEEDEVDSFEQHVDNLFAASEALKCKDARPPSFGMLKQLSERQGRPVSRGELFVLTHKQSNGSYLHDAARAIGERIAEIEQHDESSRLLPQNDSLAQALRKEHPGRVRGMGIGPTTSQVFGRNVHQPSIETQREETQRVLLELQAELAAEKLKRKAMEDEVAVEKTKR